MRDVRDQGVLSVPVRLPSTLMIQTVILVDYDNVRPSGREGSADVVEQNLGVVVESLAAHVAPYTVGGSKEIEVRLYGGWLNETAHYTQRGDWMLKRLHVARGLFSGVRVVPVLALAIAECSGQVLRGLCRSRSGMQEQKMVDSMICVDLLHFARQRTGSIFTASDDDDLVPALLSASLQSVLPLRLLRHRGAQRGLNDMHLISSRVIIEPLPPALRNQ